MASIKMKTKNTGKSVEFRVLFTSKCKYCGARVKLVVDDKGDEGFTALHPGTEEGCEKFSTAIQTEAKGLEEYLMRLIHPMPPESFWRHVPREIRGYGSLS